MAQTKIEMLLALKDRYSATLKNADKNTETATQRIKNKLGEVKNRLSEAADTIRKNTTSAFSDIKRTMSDSSYKRAGVLMAMDDLKRKLSGVKKAASEAFEKLQNDVPIIGNTVKFLSNPIGAAVSTITAIGGAVGKAASLAMDWQKGMAQINVTAGLSNEELAKMSNQMLEIGAKNVAPLEEVPADYFGRS